MECYKKSQFDKNELARIFVYRVYGKLKDYGLSDIIINSSLLELSLKSFHYFSKLKEVLLSLDIHVIEIVTEADTYAVEANTIKSIEVADGYIKLETDSKDYVFRKV